MQEIDEAIQKAESASLTMAKVKTQDLTSKDEQDVVLVSLDKVRARPLQLLMICLG